jgi:hypothetical protein
LAEEIQKFGQKLPKSQNWPFAAEPESLSLAEKIAGDLANQRHPSQTRRAVSIARPVQRTVL